MYIFVHVVTNNVDNFEVPTNHYIDFKSALWIKMYHNGLNTLRTLIEISVC